MTRLVSYSGTNNRLRRTLAKMRAGEPFTMASIGGSVSAGHGLRNPGGNLYAPTNMHRKFFDHLNRVFPAADGVIMKEGRKGRNVNAFVNGAEPARGECQYSGQATDEQEATTSLSVVICICLKMLILSWWNWVCIDPHS